MYDLYAPTAPYCAQANDVQGRCRLQNEPTFWTSLSRRGPHPLLLPVDRFGQSDWKPCYTPQSILGQLGFGEWRQ